MVNLQNLKKYNAKVIRFAVSSSEINHRTFWSDGGVMPHLGPYTNSFKLIEAVIEFRGSRWEIEENKSKFNSDLLKDGTIEDGPFSYIGAYQMIGTEEQLRGFETVILSGQVVHLGQPVVMAIKGTEHFRNRGTAQKGPCKLVLEGQGELIVNGQSYGQVKDLTLDSFTSEVLTRDGGSGIAGTTFVSLPYLRDGNNCIQLSEGLTATLTYRPLYL